MTTAPLGLGQHHAIKEAGESIGHLLQGVLHEAGYRRIHVLVPPPRAEAIEGKLPAVSLYLYNLSLDDEGLSSNRTGQFVDRVEKADGTVQEVLRDMPLWVRLDYLISTWAQTPEEEQLLLGGVIKALLEHPTISGPLLKGSSWQEGSFLPLSLSQKLDEGVLSRFWGSINQPLKPAIQCWTTVPIYPDRLRPFSRVKETEVRFFDLGAVGKRG